MTRPHRKLRALQALLMAATVFATAAAWLGSQHWFLELFGHFRLQILSAAMLLIIGYLMQHRWGWATAALFTAVVNLWAVSPHLGLPGAATNADPTGWQLVSINLNSRNTDHEAVRQLIRDVAPAIVALQEVTPRWAGELTELRQRFSHHVELPRDDNFGLALYSRWPIEAAEVVYLDGDIPAIVVDLGAPEGPLRIIAVHLRPPLTADWAAAQDRQYAALAELVATGSGAVLVTGDFNSTPWSEDFGNWIAATGFNNGRAGRSLAFTWPVSLPLLWIPIDACAVNDQLLIMGQRRGPDVGSDHYPLITSLRMIDHD